MIEITKIVLHNIRVEAGVWWGSRSRCHNALVVGYQTVSGFRVPAESYGQSYCSVCNRRCDNL